MPTSMIVGALVFLAAMLWLLVAALRGNREYKRSRRR